MMCATCRKYPRHIEIFDNEREISLSMSCPAVAKLILEKEEKVAFKTAQDDKCDPEDEAFDIFLYSVLQDTRSLLQSFLQNREESVFLRMQKVLALAHDVQNRINTRRIFEVETVLASYQKESVQRRLEGKLRSASGSRNVENIGLKADVANPIALFDLLDEFEVLDPQWQRDVLDWRELLTDTQETEEGCRNIRTFFSEDIIASDRILNR